MHLPASKDAHVIDSIKSSLNKTDSATIDFPYVSSEAANKHDDDLEIFSLGFPWLFPGGTGDFKALTRYPVSFEIWMKTLLRFEDMRFSQDKMFVFYALNYMQRRKSDEQGSFYVQSFFKDGPQNLQELKQDIEEGNLHWIEKLCYFSQCMHGSAAFWRQKRAEVYSWIEYHVRQGHGPPDLFITLSCAEYHWPDVKKLFQERIKLAGQTKELEDGEISVALMNDMTIIIQEYFQERFRKWMETVGKEIFRIKHYWARYEFAPGRGQIHCHMLVITEDALSRMKMMHDSAKLEPTQWDGFRN